MRIEWSPGKPVWISLALAAVACIAVLGFVDLSKYLGPQTEEKKEISQTDIDKQVPGTLNKEDSENAEITASLAQDGLKSSNNIKLDHELFTPEEREEVPRGESAATYTSIEKGAEKGQDQVKTENKSPVSESKGHSNKASMQGDKIHRTLKLIKSWTTEDGFNLMLVADTPIPQYKTFFLTDPSRLVIDLMGKWKISNQDELQVKNSRVRQIRLGVYQNKLRIVADLNDNTPLTITTQELPDRLNLTMKDL